MKNFSKANKLCILCVAFLILCFGICAIFLPSNSNATPLKRYVIVIDAGHGGIDGGVVGSNKNVCERDINLQFSLKLGKLYEAMGFEVVYTRTTNNGLYSENAPNKKVDDMKKRIQIIEKCNADLVISLHQNGYTLPDQRGISTFYKIGQQSSKNLADTLQSRFKKNIPYARNQALAGDYFILNECLSSCVLIECGFLTNPEEEKLLQDDEYQKKLCFEIFTGTIAYLVKQGEICIEQ